MQSTPGDREAASAAGASEPVGEGPEAGKEARARGPCGPLEGFQLLSRGMFRAEERLSVTSVLSESFRLRFNKPQLLQLFLGSFLSNRSDE